MEKTVQVRCDIPGDAVWLVATCTGDGRHTFDHLAEALQYVHSLHGKPCVVVVLTAFGDKICEVALPDRR